MSLKSRQRKNRIKRSKHLFANRAQQHREELQAVNGLEPLEPRLLLSCTDAEPFNQIPDHDSRTESAIEDQELSATIFLDFDGHGVDEWNGIADASSPGFNRTFGPGCAAHEVATITRTFERVAEDFIPFNVNVTTNAPDENADPATILHVVIGGDGEWLLDLDEGVEVEDLDLADRPDGASVIGSFANPDEPNIVWVFTDNLRQFEDQIANAISHHAGHAFGLYDRLNEDRTGPDPGANAPGGIFVSPIMSADIRLVRGHSVFNSGPTDEGPDTVSDELGALEALLGPADDLEIDEDNPYGDDQGSAHDFENAVTFESDGGVITIGDIDVFKVISTGGFFTARAVPVAATPNMNIKLTLFADGEEIVDTSDDGAAEVEYFFSGSFPRTVFMQVESTDNEGGLIGQYQLTGNSQTALPLLARGTIKGNVFQDLNLNEKLDVGDPGVRRLRVYADVNNNGRYDRRLDIAGVTDALGNYEIKNVPAQRTNGFAPVFHVVRVDTGRKFVESSFVDTFQRVQIFRDETVVAADFVVRSSKLISQFRDDKGNIVKVALIGPGTLNVQFDDPDLPGDAKEINVDGSTNRSKLVIKVGGKRRRRGVPAAETTVGDINITHGGLGALLAPRVDLMGHLIANRGVVNMVFDDVVGPASMITMGVTDLRDRAKMKFDQIFGVIISSDTTIRQLVATEIKPAGDGTHSSLTTHRVDLLTTTGQRRRRRKAVGAALPGDMQINLEIHQNDPFDPTPVVGKIFARGDVDHSTWNITGAVRQLVGRNFGPDFVANVDGVIQLLAALQVLDGEVTADDILVTRARGGVNATIVLNNP